MRYCRVRSWKVVRVRGNSSSRFCRSEPHKLHSKGTESRSLIRIEPACPFNTYLLQSKAIMAGATRDFSSIQMPTPSLIHYHSQASFWSWTCTEKIVWDRLKGPRRFHFQVLIFFNKIILDWGTGSSRNPHGILTGFSLLVEAPSNTCNQTEFCGNTPSPRSIWALPFHYLYCPAQTWIAMRCQQAPAPERCTRRRGRHWAWETLASIGAFSPSAVRLLSDDPPWPHVLKHVNAATLLLMGSLLPGRQAWQGVSKATAASVPIYG